ncbi:MAG: biopolymer transporter ExbD [Planctomycetota bacterium]|nr:biopolymer transporter ExbD [Planctomycetota bacterium]MEC9031700.1 biopolymer transporter ExbD [Planctomycetota bacterium]MEE3298657.1 biopolymer transporter ExbD [Planctomycetota bacterium]|tara:strand:+ start:11783 stop:12394 length:612 start_codon:yes stop_codon:yes gene_type:complete
MRIKQNKRVIEESELDMTPMIDIVFQLLIFFLLSAKFIALEGQLSSYLPKDRGLQASFSKIEPDEVIFFLEWVADPVNDKTGRVRCQTINYKPSPGAASGQDHEFESQDATVGQIEYGPDRRLVQYGEGVDMPGYHIPNFTNIEDYLNFRHGLYETKGSGKSIPVTINVSDNVPMQMVANIVDICTRIGITNVTIAAKEIPID